MALTPIPLVEQSYELTSTPAANTRLLNLYPEKLPTGARSAFFLKPSPGLIQVRTFGIGPIRAMARNAGFLYVISGTHLFRNSAGTGLTEDLGEIGVSPATGLVSSPSIAVGADQAVVVVPPNAFICDHDGALSLITTGAGNFPSEGVSSVATLDGYFIFTSWAGDYFFVSSLLSGSVFDGLDYAISARRPDYVQKAVSHNGELWLFGQDASAVWYNAGAVDFPFRDRVGSVLDHGLAASSTVCQLDGSLFFLGSDRIVYRTRGYAAERVSTHAIEEVLAGPSTLWDMHACSFLFEGHAFYSLSLPAAGRTFVYDCATEKWHERSSDADGLGVWRVRAAAQYGQNLQLGDGTTGAVHNLVSGSFADNGVAIPRVAVLPAIVTHGPRAFMSRLEVEMESGTDASPTSISLDWSDDGGHTWSATKTLVVLGTKSRVTKTRLGSFRQRVLRLRGTGPMTVYGVDADIAGGAT